MNFDRACPSFSAYWYSLEKVSNKAHGLYYDVVNNYLSHTWQADWGRILVSPVPTLVAIMGSPMLIGPRSCHQETSTIQSFNFNRKKLSLILVVQETWQFKCKRFLIGSFKQIYQAECFKPV